MLCQPVQVIRERVVRDTASVMTECLEVERAHVVQSSPASPARHASLTTVLMVPSVTYLSISTFNASNEDDPIGI